MSGMFCCMMWDKLMGCLLSRQQQTCLWCSTELISCWRRRGSHPWQKLLLWAIACHCVGHVLPSVVSIPPLSPTSSRCSDSVAYWGLGLHHAAFEVMSLLSLILLHLGCGCWGFSQEKGVDLEIVRATILYRIQGVFLAVDATLACTLS